MGYRGRWDGLEVVLGLGLVVFGVVTWALGLAVYEPALSSFFHLNSGRFDTDDVESLAVFGKSLRWASMMLAMAGVLFALRRSQWWGRLALGLALGWLGADIALDRLNVAGHAAAIVAGVVGVGIVTGVVLVGRRRAGQVPPYRPLAIVYSGGLVGAVAMLAPATTAALAPYTPAGLEAMTEAVAAGLAFASIVLAVTATATVPKSRAIVGAVGAPLIAAVVAVHVRLLGDPSSSYDLPYGVYVAVLSVVPVGLALLSGRFSRSRIPGAVVLAVTAPLAAFLSFNAAFFTSLNAELLVLATGDPPVSMVGIWSVGGLVSGALLGALALVPGHVGGAAATIVGPGAQSASASTDGPTLARSL